MRSRSCRDSKREKAPVVRHQTSTTATRAAADAARRSPTRTTRPHRHPIVHRRSGVQHNRTGAWPANRDNSGTRRKPGRAPAALPRPPRPVRALFRHWPDVAAARGERSPIEPISLVRRSTETPRMSKTVERPRSPVPGQLGRTEASATSIGRTGPRLRRRRHPAWPRSRSWADVPYASRARGQFFDRQLAGGQCHDRCLWACGSSSPQCEWLCSWICEGAPVVQGPQFVTR